MQHLPMAVGREKVLVRVLVLVLVPVTELGKSGCADVGVDGDEGVSVGASRGLWNGNVFPVLNATEGSGCLALDVEHQDLEKYKKNIMKMERDGKSADRYSFYQSFSNSEMHEGNTKGRTTDPNVGKRGHQMSINFNPIFFQNSKVVYHTRQAIFDLVPDLHDVC